MTERKPTMWRVDDAAIVPHCGDLYIVRVHAVGEDGFPVVRTPGRTGVFLVGDEDWTRAEGKFVPSFFGHKFVPLNGTREQ